MPAAVFRAAARSLVLLVLATPSERRETILSEALTSLWPARYLRRGSTQQAERVEPGMPQRRLSCGLGNGAGSMRMRLSGTAQVLSWRGDPTGGGVEGPPGVAV